MSQIVIKCIKHNEMKKEEYKEKEKYHKDFEKEESLEKGIELIIESKQLFMNTEQFFNSVKTTLEKYFDEIAKQ